MFAKNIALNKEMMIFQNLLMILEVTVSFFEHLHNLQHLFMSGGIWNLGRLAGELAGWPETGQYSTAQCQAIQ